MLVAANLCKTFATVKAVDGVSFKVSPGQVYGLIGPNGAGKSTTIRMILDIIRPDSGSIEIDGRAPGGPVRNIIGYLPEERGLYRKNKLVNVISYFAALRGMDRRSALAAMAPWIERFQLAPYLRRNVEELSKGNQQKAQFLISVLHRPRLLVLDEVCSGLDPVNQLLIRDALEEMRNDNRAIVFSTHQMEYADKLCDDLMLINKGHAVLTGSPSSIKSRFGRNSVQIEYKGDGAFLRGLPGVEQARIDNNFAELALSPDADANALLSAAVERLRIHRFERIDPSLEAVFIDTVGAAPAAAVKPTAVTVKPAAASADPKVRKAFFSVLLTLALLLAVGLPQLKNPGVGAVTTAVLAAAFIGSFTRFLLIRKRAKAGLKNGTETGAPG